MTADELIAALGLVRHPEGGWYVETFRDRAPRGRRGASTAIYFLLRAGEASHWHRVDAAEAWHFYAGAPLLLSISEDGRAVRTHLLGVDVAAGQRPQYVVPPNAWQAARTLGDFTLVGCTVAPAFDFSRFELAPKDWRPGLPLTRGGRTRRGTGPARPKATARGASAPRAGKRARPSRA